MLMALLLSCWACQAHETTLAKAPTLSSSQATPAPYKYAYAMPNCAPWDGSAVTIYLTNSQIAKEPNDKFEVAEPFLAISIYTDVNSMAGKTFALGRSERNGGSGHLRIKKEQYANLVTGTVQVTKVAADNQIEATYLLKFDNGTEYQGTFQAIWLPRRVLCG